MTIETEIRAATVKTLDIAQVRSLAVTASGGAGGDRLRHDNSPVKLA
ncbi:MAG: hypothetical protein ACXV5D_07395 [Halobacteriota archaeon]